MTRGERLDSRLEAEGAEFLVLAHLLIEGIQASKAYTQFPGYDLIAMDPDSGTSCRVQVKSRWATDYNKSFPLKNADCDFVAHVALNRGYRYKKPVTEGNSPGSPDVYVFPIDLLLPFRKGQLLTVHLRDIPDLENYRDRWDLVKAHLTRPGAVTPRATNHR